ncbi:Fcf2 pre-rRNA processing-domain-containing protein [Triangularia verruculosa]|uniref:Fcf2 pre-rRNA processing-domain-containing protein n=1 Tax=Triangularia verruculosa TaxID=2587418 RepID=A0AAN7AS23_9PEZI|nr:Fcf2 pre-rRNA processing-domain-containing protein [Triangularia verruculosa]
MASIASLSDIDIDRLLTEAEARIAASNGASKAVAVTTPSTKAISIATAPGASQQGEQEQKVGGKAEKLSVRVPSLPQKKKEEKDNAGNDWFNIGRTELTPELKRDLQALRMRDVIANGKQYFKKDNRKDFVPKYSQVGTIIAGATDGANQRLTRKERKRTIVEEVLSGSNTAKFKSKFHEIQEKKMSGKKSFYKKLVAGRKKR